MSETHENHVFVAPLADFSPGSTRFRYEQQADVCFQQYLGFLLIFLDFAANRENIENSLQDSAYVEIEHSPAKNRREVR